DSALPWTREERIVVMAVVDYAWVTWHFASQHFGALSLYRARVGRAACARTRRLDRIFALLVGGLFVFVGDVLAGTAAYQDRGMAGARVAVWLVENQDAIGNVCPAVVLVATAAILLVELRSPRRSWPRVLYIVGLAMMVGVALRPRSLFLYLV